MLKQSEENMETLDFLPNTDIYLFQRKDMFRMNTDTALLGNFMKIKEEESVLDIGTNNGALLLYASRFTKGKLIGVDIQEDACQQAIKNLDYNQITNYEILCGDVLNLELPKVNVVVCNPPYFKNCNVNGNEKKRIARHEIFLPLSKLLEKVSSLLEDGGRFYMVHRANRLQDILYYMRENLLEVKTIQFIYDESKKEAIGILLEAYKRGLPNCCILSPHVVKR